MKKPRIPHKDAPLPEPETLVRIDGRLSGSARLPEQQLENLVAAVTALSSQKAYGYDLDLSAGRFSLMIEEPVLPLTAFVPDPETALTQDIQNILEVLPPQERTGVSCTLRALWRESGEVIGMALQVVPPGRVKAQKKIRPEEAYDRLVAKQEAIGYGIVPRKKLSLGWKIFLGLAVLASATVLLTQTQPWSMPYTLVQPMEEVDLAGLSSLVEIGNLQFDPSGISFMLIPCEDFPARVESMRGASPPQEESLADFRKRSAIEGLLRGSLYLEIMDETGVIMDRIPLDLEAFTGMAAMEVRTRPLHLTAPAAGMRVRP